MTFICKDLNNSPYIFNYTFKRTNNNISIQTANVYDSIGFNGSGSTTRQNETYIQFFKKTVNYYSVSAIETFVTVIGSESANSEYVSLIDQNFYSINNTGATINNVGGYLQI